MNFLALGVQVHHLRLMHFHRIGREVTGWNLLAHGYFRRFDNVRYFTTF